ncbi:MAG: Rrf2 family transcriptional regulator, partial [bacterium]|nr:Rrf2 family transcriptional regulator [bacterium]
ACMALLDLALHHEDGAPLQIHTIAERQKIPKEFLLQILNELKRAGLVDSKRGAAGGYYLAKQPKSISVGDVLRIIDGSILEMECFKKEEKGFGKGCEREEGCNFRSVWDEVRKIVVGAVNGITFEDLSRKVRGKELAKDNI